VLLSMPVSTAAMPQALPELETIFKAQGIDRTSVIYRDEHGKTITEQAFAYAKKHPRQSVLAVTFDDAATARYFVAAHGFSWPVLVDGMVLHAAVGVNAYPTMALLGRTAVCSTWRCRRRSRASPMRWRSPTWNDGSL
jgi:hypothetical protein